MSGQKGSKRKNENGTGGIIKRSIEECGRHPFATGLFAILGVWGLIFAFYDFNVSQTQADESALVQAEIKEEIEQVGIRVGEIPKIAEEAEQFDPIEASFDHIAFGSDNVAFPLANFDFKSVDVSDGELWRDINRIRRENPAAFSYEWNMNFSVTSAADRKYVQLAPYLVFQVLDVQPISDVGSLSEGGRGGAANIREFHISIPPAKGVYFAPLVDTYTAKHITNIDYLSLAPREPEEFVVFLSYMPGYIYTIRFGLHYKFENEHSIHWVNEGYRAGAPDSPHPQLKYDGSIAVRMHPDGWNGDTGTMPDVTTFYQSAIAGQVFADAGKVFRPSQIPQQELSR